LTGGGEGRKVAAGGAKGKGRSANEDEGIGGTEWRGSLGGTSTPWTTRGA